MPDTFGFIPWGHHIYIFTKSQSLDEALFYINKVSTEGWSRTLLEHHVTAHLFQSQGSAITNFEATLPSAQVEEAKQLLKKDSQKMLEEAFKGIGYQINEGERIWLI